MEGVSGPPTSWSQFLVTGNISEKKHIRKNAWQLYNIIHGLKGNNRYRLLGIKRFFLDSIDGLLMGQLGNVLGKNAIRCGWDVDGYTSHMPVI